MYLSKFGLIIGFHGCDESVRDKIVNNKAKFSPSENDYDWLGSGVYFWENNQQRALMFASELKDKKRGETTVIKTPAVLGAVIDLGLCLDLLDSEYIGMVKESYENLQETCRISGIALPENKPLRHSEDLLLRNLDCSVIENVHRSRTMSKLRPFDSVRGVFVEGASLYPSAGFNEKNHIQICIRNPNCIKGFFLPREEDNRFLMP